MKLLLAFFFLVSSLSFSTNLDDLWNNALKAPAEERALKWENWIASANEVGITSPEAYFNLAQAHWSQNNIAFATKNLLLSAQLRTHIFGTLRDLELLNEIQKALLDTPSPLDSMGLKSFFLLNETTIFIGKMSIFWLVLISLFLRFGFTPAKKGSLLLAFMAVALTVLGITWERSHRGLTLPVILTHQGKTVPIYRSKEPEDENPLTELPSGLLVIPREESDNWIKIEQPLTGWIKREMTLSFPNVLSAPLNNLGAYPLKNRNHFAHFSISHSGYPELSEKQ